MRFAFHKRIYVIKQFNTLHILHKNYARTNEKFTGMKKKRTFRLMHLMTIFSDVH